MNKKNILAIDIGNTNIHLGVFQRNHLTRLFNLPNKDANKIIKHLSNLKNIDGTIIASVVPQLTQQIQKIIKKKLKTSLLLLNHKTKTDLILRYKNPEKLGADRIANAVAGKCLYGFPLIVVSFGTAVTFDCLSDKGEYIGGLILPGPKTMLDSLNQNTAQLPLINFSVPKTIIGQSTQDCIISGVYHSQVGTIQHIGSELKIFLGKKTKVVATGGFAKVLSASAPVIDFVNIDLTLQGLKIIWETNNKNI